MAEIPNDPGCEREWVSAGVMPDWSNIHQNVLQVARITASGMFNKAEEANAIGDSDPGAAMALGKTEFMRKVGFDERYIVMLTSWIDEQQQIVNELGSVFMTEIGSTLDALKASHDRLNTETEE